MLIPLFTAWLCPRSGSLDPISQPGLIFPDDIQGVIGAAAVDDDVFQVGIALQQDRADGLLDELPLVEGGGDHADLRPGGMSGYQFWDWFDSYDHGQPVLPSGDWEGLLSANRFVHNREDC